MVGVPSALHLSAGLLAVAASTGLAFAIWGGALARADGAGAARQGLRGRDGLDLVRAIGVLGALTYAAGHVLAGAVAGDVELWTWLQAAGLLGIAVGGGPTRRGETLPLLIPLVPTAPSLVAGAAGLLAAARVLGAGRRALPAAAGLLLLGLAHGAAPTQPVVAEWLTVGGALLVGVWLWVSSANRILAKLLSAFVSALLALAILLSVVLSTVGSAQLTADELDRLSRVAAGLTAEVQAWPGEAVASAAAIAIAPRPLLTVQLTPPESADLYRVGFADQDFFLVLDRTGTVVNRHPQDLGGAIELGLGGDELVRAVRDGTGDVRQAGGLLSTGGRIVAFGAVALRTDDLLPEDPPAGVLVTGRLVDVVWAEQQAATLDVGVVGVVGGTAVFTSDSVGIEGDRVVDALGSRTSADLGLSDRALFAASATITDPERGADLGRIVVTSTPDVIATLESTQTQRLFLVSLVGGLIAALVAAVVTRRFVRPITQLTTVAQRVGGGDLTGRARIDSPDEVGLLGATFDEMVGSLAAQQDELTSAARTESRLRGRLESLTTSMGDGLIAVDVDGLVIQFNPAAEQLTGLSALDVVGQPLDEVLRDRIADEQAGDPLPGVGSTAALAIDRPTADEAGVARAFLLRPDGFRTPVAATAAPVRSPDGEVLGRVFVLRDISRELEVEQMKTEFLANVSHELRTPITPIKGYANVLARRDVGPEATQRFAGEILSSTRRLERIVGMIVDFAGLDSGRVVLQPEPTDLPALVGQALADWQAEHTDRVFGNFLNGGLPPVMADPVYLRRVLDELLDNAVKFSPEGDPVDVVASTDGDRVRLSVVDRGIGIDPRAAANLFADFRQLDGTETRHYGGLGLGLGLVKRILDGTDATAEVESDPGVGATFSVLLPVGGPVPASPAPAVGSTPAVVPPPPGVTAVPPPPR